MANPVWNAFLAGRDRGDEMLERRRARNEQRDTKARNAMIGSTLAKGRQPGQPVNAMYDQGANVAFEGGDLTTGLALQQAGQAAQANEVKLDDAQAERLRKIAPAMAKAYAVIAARPLEERAALSQRLHPLLQHAGLDPSQADDDYSDATLAQEIEMWRALAPADDSGLTPYQEESLRLRQRADERAGEAADRSAAAAERANDQQSFNQARALRSDFDDLSKSFRDVQQSYRTATSVGSRRDPQGDLALVVAYTKMLDPGSVAREGEVSLTQQTAGALQQAQLFVPKLMEGKTLLPDQVRTALLATVGDIYGQYEQAFRRRVGEYQQLAQQSGIDPALVVVGYGGGGAAPAAASAPAPQQQPQRAQIPPAAVNDLRADPSPEAQAEFDEVFGEGAAASILGAGGG